MLVLFDSVGIGSEEEDVEQELSMGSLVLFSMFGDVGELEDVDDSVRFANSIWLIFEDAEHNGVDNDFEGAVESVPTWLWILRIKICIEEDNAAVAALMRLWMFGSSNQTSGKEFAGSEAAFAVQVIAWEACGGEEGGLAFFSSDAATSPLQNAFCQRKCGRWEAMTWKLSSM